MSNHTKSLAAAGKFGGASCLDQPPVAVADKRLLTGLELASELGVSLRLVEKWSANGTIPKLHISPRMVRYQLPKVRAALVLLQGRMVG